LLKFLNPALKVRAHFVGLIYLPDHLSYLDLGIGQLTL
jgi:hypothetical protein